MPDAFDNPYPGETEKKRRSGRRLTLVALFGAVLAAAAAYVAGGAETLIGGLAVFAVVLVALRVLIGATGRYMLLEMLFWLVAYAAVAVISDGLFNGFGKLIGVFSIMTGH
jgi:hypothetical protein